MTNEALWTIARERISRELCSVGLGSDEGAGLADSPDLNPIEMPYSKFKALLRKAAAPLQAYGAARGVVTQRRVYLDEAPRPPAPVPYGWRGAR